jgi:hypothetical protein
MADEVSDEKKPPAFRAVRAYMKNGATFKVIYVTVNRGAEFNTYLGANDLWLCDIKKEDVSAFVNIDVPEETVDGEKGPVKTFPAGITISSGYVF